MEYFFIRGKHCIIFYLLISNVICIVNRKKEYDIVLCGDGLSIQGVTIPTHSMGDLDAPKVAN